MTTVNYKSASVDIEAGNQAVRQIKKVVEGTFSPNVLSQIGGFASMLDLNPVLSDYQHPILVQSIDGVGTKMMVAEKMQQFDTIGMDLVAATCNDIIVVGAKPLTLLDYIANEKLNVQAVEQIVTGMAQACKDCGVSLMGGETAEMPGTYCPGQYDLAGCITGVVDKSKMITGDAIKPGDRVVALASNGLHTNGYSLARKLLFEIGRYDPQDYHDALGQTIGEALLQPHMNYTNPVHRLLDHQIGIKGMAHITGGGILENIPRILPKDCAVECNLSKLPSLPIFDLLAALGTLDKQTLYQTFNMGVGMVLLMEENALSKAQLLFSQYSLPPLIDIGVVVPGHQEVHLQ